MPRPTSPTRRHLLAMVLSVLALDAVAVALYYGAGLSDAGTGVRNAFTIAWTIATLFVVGMGLGRIRRERRK